MTSRGLALIWCVVITLAALVAVALPTFNEDEETIFGNIPAAPVIVIGSSLMYHAVPPFGEGTDSLLGDGREHARLAISSITEVQTVDLLQHVLNGGAKTVLIEANALAFDFASRAPASDQGSIRAVALTKPLLDLSARARQPLSALINQRPKRHVLTSEAEKLDADFSVKLSHMAKLYPLHLRFPAPPEALETALTMAAAAGVEVILIAPPRSQAAANAMGAEATETLRLHFQALAYRLNLPLFQPSAVWPNDHFIDAAHMSRRGRARFLNELAQWWASRP